MVGYAVLRLIKNAEDVYRSHFFECASLFVTAWLSRKAAGQHGITCAAETQRPEARSCLRSSSWLHHLFTITTWGWIAKHRPSINSPRFTPIKIIHLKVAEFLRNSMENVNHIESASTMFWNNHPVRRNWTGCWPKCQKVMILLLSFFYVLSLVMSSFSFGAPIRSKSFFFLFLTDSWPNTCKLMSSFEH